MAPTTSVRRALAFDTDPTLGEPAKATKDTGRSSRSPAPKTTAKQSAAAAASPQRRAAAAAGSKAVDVANGKAGKSKKERACLLGSSDTETDDSEGTASSPPIAVPRTPGRKGKAEAAAAASPTHNGVSAALKAHKTPVKKQPSEAAEDDAEGAAAASISPAKKAKITAPKAAASTAKKVEYSSSKSDVVCIPEVERVYSIVQKKTGAIGGNGAFGAIYGELTIGSMQRVIVAMKKFCELTADSAFIDVGSGLGKPNFHVAQDPGVSLSYGVELESIRYELAIHNLRAVLMEPAPKTAGAAPSKKTSRARKGSAASAAAAAAAAAATATAAAEAPGTPRAGQTQALSQSPPKEKEGKGRRQSTAPPAPVLRQHNVFFAQGDILDAESFNPFTHVYAFDVGFPPVVRQAMKRAFERSSTARYLISYWKPKETIERLEYPVELLVQVPTSLTGSSEGHTAYLYRRNKPPGPAVGPDAMFAEGTALCSGSQAKDGSTDGDGGAAALVAHVEKKFRNFTEGGRRTRSRNRNPAAAAGASSAAAASEEATDPEASS